MTSVDGQSFRSAMGRFATGVTVITTQGPDGPHGMTDNAVTSVSLDPPMILVCVGRAARLARFLEPGTRFVVNVLAEVQEPLARYFARAWPESQPAPDYQFTSIDGTIALAGAIATLICEVCERHEGGDHHIVLGTVSALHVDRENRSPLLFFGGTYRTISQPGRPTRRISPGLTPDGQSLTRGTELPWSPRIPTGRTRPSQHAERSFAAGAPVR